MRTFGNRHGNRRKLLLGAAGFLGAATLVTFGSANVTPGLTQTQQQAQAQGAPSAAAAPVYRYEVVSVKPCNPGTTGGYTMNTPDGYKATCALLIILIDYAYGIHYVEQLPGAPSWISSERFDVDARMDVPVAEALQKMSKDDRALAREQMLQALLADRFKLVVHRETRVLPVYALVIGKNGTKLKASKPDDNSPDRIKDAEGHAAINLMSMHAGEGGVTWKGQAVSMEHLIGLLSPQVGRMVVDKTGLTGNYDFTMQFAREQGPPATAASDAPGGASLAPEPGGADLFTAIQEQLGLKLEATKAPIEVIVIDHVERPSGN